MNAKVIMKNIMTIMVGRVKPFLLLCFAVLISNISVAQSGDRGMLLTEVGGGINIYTLSSNQWFKEFPAASTDINLATSYYFHNRVGLGIELEMHNYAHDQNDEVQFLKSNRGGLGLEFAGVNNQHFSLNFGMYVGGFNFGYNTKDSIQTAEFVAQGIYQKINISARYYFGKKARIGIFLKGGIINNPMRLTKVKINGEEKEEIDHIKVTDFRINSIGFYAKIGVTFNFRVKHYEKK